MGIINLQNQRKKRQLAEEQAMQLTANALSLSGNNEILKKYIEDHDLKKSLMDILYESSICKEDSHE